MTLCSRCQTEINSDYSFCQDCGYPLNKEFAQKKVLAKCLVFGFIFLFLSSVGVLIYIEKEHPDYGLRNRLGLVWQILSKDDWINESEKVKRRKIELAALKKEIEKIKKDKNISKRLEIINRKLNLTKRRLERLQKRTKRIKN